MDNEMIQKALRALRDREGGISMRKAAQKAGVGESTWAKWERGDSGMSDKSRRKVEEAYEIDLRTLAGQNHPTGWVRSKGALDRWQDRVLGSSLGSRQIVVLQTFARMLIKELWIVSTRPQEVAEYKGEDKTWVESVWSDVLNSPFVVQVGTAEWALKLVIPD